MKKRKSQKEITLSESRRLFLEQIGGGAAALGIPGLIALTPNQTKAQAGTEADAATTRLERAYQVRANAALAQKNLPLPLIQTNGDEDRYANKIGNYSKGLPHNQLGEVDTYAYQTLLYAVTNGAPEDFERIQIGLGRKQVNPQASLAFEMMGADSHHLFQAAPPAFSSAEIAAEIAETYWQAVTRDVNFSEYSVHSLTNAAAADLANFSGYQGPRSGRTPISPSNNSLESEIVREVDDRTTRSGRLGTARRSLAITTDLLFRGKQAGDAIGPYISQFLWKDIQFGAQAVVQKIRTPVAGDDYMITYDDWLAVQNGAGRGVNRWDATARYIRNNRDLAEWVHNDFTYQAFLNAAQILLSAGAPADAGNPYRTSRTQLGFSTFGGPQLLGILGAVATAALNAVWYHKWIVHRRVRPEAFAGRIHNHITSAASYPIHPDILNSQAVKAIFNKNGNYLLPQAFPEGSPTHPSYGSGHSTISGACVTILKAWFDESWVLPNPVTAAPDGLSLLKYVGADLTVGNELDKLANNVGIGRLASGVHYRSDHWESLRLGEAVAIGFLQDMKFCLNEQFSGFSLTKFDGTKVTV